MLKTKKKQKTKKQKKKLLKTVILNQSETSLWKTIQS